MPPVVSLPAAARSAPRRSAALACAAALLAGCGGAGDRGADTGAAGSTAATTPAPAPAGESATQRAGTWVGRSVQEGQDSAAATWRLVATADTTGWTLAFLPSSPPLPVRVLAAAGDSVVTEVGPYPSPSRPGARVVTRTTARFRGDRLTGTYEARRVGAADTTVFRGRVEATRAP